MLVGLIDFIKEVFHVYPFNKSSMKEYLSIKDIYKPETLQSIARAIAYGGAKDFQHLQRFFPDMTRERLRQIVMKIERVVKFHEK